MCRGPDDHVLEIDTLAQSRLILSIDGAEDLQEGVCPFAHFQGRGFLGADVDLVNAGATLADASALLPLDELSDLREALARQTERRR